MMRYCTPRSPFSGNRDTSNIDANNIAANVAAIGHAHHRAIFPVTGCVVSTYVLTFAPYCYRQARSRIAVTAQPDACDASSCVSIYSARTNVAAYPVWIVWLPQHQPATLVI
jgi:hypothetical protein